MAPSEPPSPHPLFLHPHVRAWVCAGKGWGGFLKAMGKYKGYKHKGYKHKGYKRKHKGGKWKW